MFKWITELFAKKPEESFYKFEIGREVNIHDGWEKPIGKGFVENRSYGYFNSHIRGLIPYPIYLVNGKQYRNSDLSAL